MNLSVVEERKVRERTRLRYMYDLYTLSRRNYYFKTIQKL